LVQNHIIPTAIAYQNKLIQNAKGLKELGIKNSQVLKIIESMSGYIETLQAEVEKMTDARKKANVIEDTRDKAIAYCDDVKGKYFESIRYAVDKLELIVDDEDWPLVKYREMLFLR
ncbi:MAG: glutamine synthetase type III, partial [Fulvivirga sp.]